MITAVFIVVGFLAGYYAPRVHFFTPAMRTRSSWFIERIRHAETKRILGFHVQLGWIGWSFYY